MKCGLFDGASGAVAGIGKRKGSYKRKKDIQKSQPIASDATRRAIWSGKQDSHKYVCMFQPSGKECPSVCIGVGWK